MAKAKAFKQRGRECTKIKNLYAKCMCKVNGVLLCGGSVCAVCVKVERAENECKKCK